MPHVTNLLIWQLIKLAFQTLLMANHILEIVGKLRFKIGIKRQVVLQQIRLFLQETEQNHPSLL
ncbi:hypothetical protein FD61_01920 [Streptococcus macedonicus]|nr:hypothetical protein FD61_01920 [Streptococcus macedonicus]